VIFAPLRETPSAEAELRLILQQAAAARAADFWAQAEALRAQSGRQRYESGRLLREKRDLPLVTADRKLVAALRTRRKPAPQVQSLDDL
jgi:hypothetical protein